MYMWCGFKIKKGFCVFFVKWGFCEEIKNLIFEGSTLDLFLGVSILGLKNLSSKWSLQSSKNQKSNKITNILVNHPTYVTNW